MSTTATIWDTAQGVSRFGAEGPQPFLGSVWSFQMSDEQRSAALTAQALCACGVRLDERNGGSRCAVSRPCGLPPNAAPAALRSLPRELPLAASRALHSSALGGNVLHAVNDQYWAQDAKLAA